MKNIQGFSKLSSTEKLDVLLQINAINQTDYQQLLSFRHPDPEIQELFEKFTENVISNFHLPFSIAPNFLINSKIYQVPMVVEESSIVAAASWSARYWSTKGGFQTRVLSETKVGQIHFKWAGSLEQLHPFSEAIERELRTSVKLLTENMEKRGGGIREFEWIDLTKELPGVFQCRIAFLTGDSMGANFINSCLEEMARSLNDQLEHLFPALSKPTIIMAILSNYTPDCLVECTIECEAKQFADIKGVADPLAFAEKFILATEIARLDPYRAVTHNKGIFNGMDAVVLATANDFRAFEAGAHAFASKSGHYTSLSRGSLDNNVFKYTLQVPMAVGTVGGLTGTHPLAAFALRLLGQPSAAELMEIIAATGMATNFSAVKALVTNGIQSGHMKMHFSKILLQLGASAAEELAAIAYFKGKTITYREVSDFLSNHRKNH